MSPEELAAVQARLDELAGPGWLDGDDPLTDEQKALIESRAAAHERDPGSSIPWAEFKERLSRRAGE